MNELFQKENSVARTGKEIFEHKKNCSSGIRKLDTQKKKNRASSTKEIIMPLSSCYFKRTSETKVLYTQNKIKQTKFMKNICISPLVLEELLNLNKKIFKWNKCVRANEQHCSKKEHPEFIMLFECEKVRICRTRKGLVWSTSNSPNMMRVHC